MFFLRDLLLIFVYAFGKIVPRKSLKLIRRVFASGMNDKPGTLGIRVGLQHLIHARSSHPGVVGKIAKEPCCVELVFPRYSAHLSGWRSAHVGIDQALSNV